MPLLLTIDRFLLNAGASLLNDDDLLVNTDALF